jgi:hypothetical protein
MKEFCVSDFDRFLEIADTVKTPFKFYEEKPSDLPGHTRIEAKVWLRTAFLSYETDKSDGEAADKLVELLKHHGFVCAEIREAVSPIR